MPSSPVTPLSLTMTGETKEVGNAFFQIDTIAKTPIQIAKLAIDMAKKSDVLLYNNTRPWTTLTSQEIHPNRNVENRFDG